MHEYTAHLVWQRGDQPFVDRRYSRKHLLRFDGGAEVSASASPAIVRAPMSDPAAVDPEELFVASLASCHMLWFLHIAAREGFRVDSYVDDPAGVLETAASGRTSVSRVTLRPAVSFSGDRAPTPEEHVRMHQRAHEECFIGNSVKTEVRCEPVFAESVGSPVLSGPAGHVRGE